MTDAISKLNIAVGTIMTELKSERLELFGEDISKNVDKWESMINLL